MTENDAYTGGSERESYFNYMMGTFGCPACDKTFTCDDGSEWEDYAGHLRGHLIAVKEDSRVRGFCCVCGEIVLEPDEHTDKFDPSRPMDLTEIDEYGDVCHLGCSDELMDETHASVPGFDEITSSYTTDSE